MMMIGVMVEGMVAVMIALMLLPTQLKKLEPPHCNEKANSLLRWSDSLENSFAVDLFYV